MPPPLYMGGEEVDGTPSQGFSSIKEQRNYLSLSGKPLGYFTISHFFCWLWRQMTSHDFIRTANLDFAIFLEIQEITEIESRIKQKCS